MADIQQVKHLFEQNEYAETNNPAVDMCTAFISYNRRFGKRVKSMTLKHDMYYMFKAHIDSKMEVKDDLVIFDLDGTEIRLSELPISAPFVAEII